MKCSSARQDLGRKFDKHVGVSEMANIMCSYDNKYDINQIALADMSFDSPSETAR